MTFLRSLVPWLLLLSALLLAVAIMQAWSWLGWLCLLPFFMAIRDSRGRKALGRGAFFGAAFGAILLYWMPSLIGAFAGSAVLGSIVYLAAILIAALYFGCLGWGMKAFARYRAPLWQQALWAAAVWSLGEWMFCAALPGMPWFGLFRLSNALLDDLYAIQPAELAGVYGISFITVLVNYLLADAVAIRRWKRLVAPSVIIAAYLLLGYLLLQRFDGPCKEGQVPVAILCDNTPPDVKWNAQNGPQLVQKLLSLNREATAAGPGIVLWSESVVPWTYRPDDDFVKEVLKTADGKGPTAHIMGLMTDYSSTLVYNSAYCLLPGGQVTGRYDKQYPVSLAEHPLAFCALPFAGRSDRQYEQPGQNPSPLPTPFGKAGVLICNDVTVPGATVGQARKGAGFLVSVSNDAWFADVAYLVRQHFLNTRLRAVEVRKDMAINCNMGVSGRVQASGRIQQASGASESFVAQTILCLHHHLTVYTAYPFFFQCLMSAILLSLLFNQLKNLNKNRMQ